jgi:hypothetical protein
LVASTMIGVGRSALITMGGTNSRTALFQVMLRFHVVLSLDVFPVLDGLE